MNINNKKDIEGVLQGLKKELATLAPYPHYSAPLALKLTNSHIADNIATKDLLRNLFALAANDNALTANMLNIPAAQAFNLKAAQTKAMINSLKVNLPRRLGLERWISYYTRKLYALNKDAALRLAA